MRVISSRFTLRGKFCLIGGWEFRGASGVQVGNESTPEVAPGISLRSMGLFLF